MVGSVVEVVAVVVGETGAVAVGIDNDGVSYMNSINQRILHLKTGQQHIRTDWNL